MTKMSKDDRFTKIATDLLLDVRNLVNWGLDTGNTTPERLRLTVAARREAAQKLIASGMSQHQAAKVLGVSQMTVQRDLKQNVSEVETKRNTGSVETKARRLAIAERARSAGTTPAPIDKYRIIYADPPWDYGAHAQPDYHIEQRDHYPVMELKDICAIPVIKWVERDAVLFLWATLRRSPGLEPPRGIAISRICSHYSTAAVRRFAIAPQDETLPATPGEEMTASVEAAP